MTSERQFSDEYLNSFIDNELTAQEKGQVYQHTNQDDALNRRVCELRKMHELVQLAYRHPPAAPAGIPYTQNSSGLRRGVAAGIVLLFGALLGWQQFGPALNGKTGQAAHTHVAQVASAIPAETLPDRQPARAPAANNSAPVSKAAAVQAGDMKVLFHLSSNDPVRVRELLDEAENLLKLYRKQNQPAQVEIVTNADGLNLLLAGKSHYPERISRMQKEYRNLIFAACQNTMDKFNSQGIETRLLPGTIVIDSGVAQIIRLQQQGWVYIQV
jgi:hypothetical protein